MDKRSILKRDLWMAKKTDCSLYQSYPVCLFAPTVAAHGGRGLSEI